MNTFVDSPTTVSAQTRLSESTSQETNPLLLPGSEKYKLQLVDLAAVRWNKRNGDLHKLLQNAYQCSTYAAGPAIISALLTCINNRRGDGVERCTDAQVLDRIFRVTEFSSRVFNAHHDVEGLIWLGSSLRGRADPKDYDFVISTSSAEERQNKNTRTPLSNCSLGKFERKIEIYIKCGLATDWRDFLLSAPFIAYIRPQSGSLSMPAFFSANEGFLNKRQF
jgi:hypothetical protein